MPSHKQDQEMHLREHTIACYLDGSLRGAEKQQLETHLADCAACCEAMASAYRMVQAVEHTVAPSLALAAVQRVGGLVPLPPPMSILEVLLGRPARFALATVVMVGLALVTYLSLVQPDAVRFRTETSAPHFSATTPEDGAMVPTAALSFSWTSLSNAVGYRLTLYTDEGTVLWQGREEGTTFTLPSTVTLETETYYLWHVEGLLADGTTLITEYHAFTVAP